VLSDTEVPGLTIEGYRFTRSDASHAVIVLAGGASRRFGGGAKTDADLAGRSVLERVLDGLPPGGDVVVVGPTRPLPGVRFVREEPPGGGPAAGVAAGLAAVGAGVVVVLAGDLPFAARAVPRLLAALAGAAAGGAVDGAVGIDPAGVRQPLLGAFRAAALGGALVDPAGRSMRSVLAGLSLVEVPLDARESLDVDTAADLEAARDVADRRGADGP
jgi:molybdopterin-guanine dinucleotide biosynthesis protein A